MYFIYYKNLKYIQLKKNSSFIFDITKLNDKNKCKYINIFNFIK